MIKCFSCTQRVLRASQPASGQEVLAADLSAPIWFVSRNNRRAGWLGGACERLQLQPLHLRAPLHPLQSEQWLWRCEFECAKFSRRAGFVRSPLSTQEQEQEQEQAQAHAHALQPAAALPVVWRTVAPCRPAARQQLRHNMTCVPPVDDWEHRRQRHQWPKRLSGYLVPSPSCSAWLVRGARDSLCAAPRPMELRSIERAGALVTPAQQPKPTKLLPLLLILLLLCDWLRSLALSHSLHLLVYQQTISALASG